jgi:hypothetical protein
MVTSVATAGMLEPSSLLREVAVESVARAVERIDARLSALGRAERRAVARSSEMTALDLQAARQSVTAALLAGRLDADEATAFFAALDRWVLAPVALRVATLLALRETLIGVDHRWPRQGGLSPYRWSFTQPSATGQGVGVGECDDAPMTS